MDPLLALGDRRLDVEPGQEVRTTVKVRNSGTIVEQYRLDVLGPAAPWAEIVPAEVSVYPGTDVEVQLILRPPRAADTPSGEVAFAVRCTSLESPDEVAVEEGDVVVGAIVELSVQLAPNTSRGRWRGRHRVLVDNRGTAPARLRLSAKDPAERLSFGLAPDVVEAPAGGKGSANLKVRVRTPMLRGSLQQHRFQLTYDRLMASPTATPGLVPPSTVDGVFEQKPVVSKAVMGVVAVLVAGGAVAAALSLTGGGSGDDTEAAGLPPPAPTLESVTAVGSAAVQIQWTNNPNVSGYSVQQVAPESVATTPVVAAEQKVDAALARFTWSELTPATKYCYRVVAVNDVGPSPASATECADTPGEAPFPPPTALTATPVEGSAAVALAWTAAAPDARNLVLVDNQANVEVVGQSTQLTVTPGTHCFSVLGRTQDGRDTPPSNQVCLPITAPVDPTAATTTAAPVATTVSPTVSDAGGRVTTVAGAPTTPTPTTPPVATTVAPTPTTAAAAPVLVEPGWMAQLEAFPADDYAATEPLERAQTRRKALEAAGAAVDLAPSESLLLPGVRSWILYVDGFKTQDEAAQVCRDLRTAGLLGAQSCLTIERGSRAAPGTPGNPTGPAATTGAPGATATTRPPLATPTTG